MDWNLVIELVGKLLAAFVVGLLATFIPKVNVFLNEKIGVANSEKIALLIKTFVSAAEQLFKENDPEGTIRNAYVKEQLEELGVLVTEEINAQIESAVYELNHSIIKALEEPVTKEEE